MEFQNGAGLEGYRNPETSSPTHGSYPYLALAQSQIRLLVNRQRAELTEMNGHATVEINHLISQIQLFHLIITVLFILLFFEIDISSFFRLDDLFLAVKDGPTEVDSGSGFHSSSQLSGAHRGQFLFFNQIVFLFTLLLRHPPIQPFFLGFDFLILLLCISQNTYTLLEYLYAEIPIYIYFETPYPSISIGKLSLERENQGKIFLPLSLY